MNWFRNKTLTGNIKFIVWSDLSRKIGEIRPDYEFDVSCQGFIPESIIAFLESENFEDAVRKAVSIGGDSDTITCIAGNIAQAFYKEVPYHIKSEVLLRLLEELSVIVERFETQYLLNWLPT